MADKVLVLRDPGDLIEDTSLLDGKADRENGFVDRAESSISFVDGTRTFTIAPTGSSFDYFYASVRYTKSAPDNLVIPDTEGPHYIYYEGDALKSTTVFTNEIITTFAFVVAVYWDATGKESIFFNEERHGHVFDSVNHLYEHDTFGARFGGGLGLGNMDVDGNGDDATAAQFSVEGGTVWDEDLDHVITGGVPQTLSPIAEIPMFYRTGANGYWRRVAATQYPVTTAGTGRAAWNEFTAGAWQLTETGSNDFVLTHHFGTGDTRHPVIGLVGQAEYATVSLARTGAFDELKALLFGPLAVLTPEFVAIATVIWHTSNAYSNAVKSRVRSTDGGADYIDWRSQRGGIGAGSGGAGAAPVFLDSEFRLVDETNLLQLSFQLSGLTANREKNALDAAGTDVLSDAVLTANSLPFVDASGRLDEDTTFVRDPGTGNVGVGTSAPGARLEVAGQVKITGGTPGAGKVLTDLAGTGLGTWEAAGAGASGWTDDGTVVRLTTSTDRVGVGTASPLGILNVDGVGSLNVPNFLVSGATNEVMQLRYDSNGQPFTFSGALNSDIATRVLTNSGGAFVLQGFTGAGADAGVRFQAHGAGTRTAAHVLFETFDTDGATGRQAPGASDQIFALYAGDSATGTLTFNVLGSGNVGIGTAAPAAPLHVSHSTSGELLLTTDDSGHTAADGLFVGYTDQAWMWNYEASSLKLATSNATRVTVDADGLVGIGTDGPVQLLHVHEASSDIAAMQFTNTTTGSLATDGAFVGLGASETLSLWNYEDTTVFIGQNDDARARYESSGFVGNNSNDDYDFRLETTGLTFGLHVDAGNDAVGAGGAANASYALAVTGSLRVSVDIDYVGDLNDISDAALKENVTTLADHLGALRDRYMSLRPVRFTWKEQPFLDVGLPAPGGPTDFKYGFISQEVDTAFSEITRTMNLGNLLDPSDPRAGDDDYQEFGGVRTGETQAYLGLKKLELVAITTAMVQWLIEHAETTRTQLDVAQDRVLALETQMAQVIQRILALESA